MCTSISVTAIFIIFIVLVHKYGRPVHHLVSSSISLFGIFTFSLPRFRLFVYFVCFASVVNFMLRFVLFVYLFEVNMHRNIFPAVFLRMFIIGIS